MADDKRPQFNDVLGALVSGVSHARRVADAEVMRIAQFYRNHEYLSGLTVPRLRVSKIAIDLPVLFDEVIPAEAAEANTPEYIANSSRGYVERSVAEMKERLSQGHHKLDEDVAAMAMQMIDYINKKWLDNFEKMQRSRLQLVDRLLKKAMYKDGVSDVAIMEAVGESTEDLLTEMVTEIIRAQAERVDESQRHLLIQNTMVSSTIKELIRDIRTQTEQSALMKDSTPASFSVRVDSEAIKNAGSPQSVTRLRMVLNEEGLEWSTEESDSGETSWRLLPE